MSKKERDPNQAHPPGWPNMPTRSAEHDREPPTKPAGAPPAEVTEAQRELERSKPAQR